MRSFAGEQTGTIYNQLAGTESQVSGHEWPSLTRVRETGVALVSALAHTIVAYPLRCRDDPEDGTDILFRDQPQPLVAGIAVEVQPLCSEPPADSGRIDIEEAGGSPAPYSRRMRSWRVWDQPSPALLSL